VHDEDCAKHALTHDCTLGARLKPLSRYSLFTSSIRSKDCAGNNCLYLLTVIHRRTSALLDRDLSGKLFFGLTIVQSIVDDTSFSTMAHPSVGGGMTLCHFTGFKPGCSASNGSSFTRGMMLLRCVGYRPTYPEQLRCFRASSFSNGGMSWSQQSASME
jgi:hypothetical protein